MADSFTHLHVHTEFSMLDGASRLDELVGKAAAEGMPALGMTDHGNVKKKASSQLSVPKRIWLTNIVRSDHRDEDA